MLNLVLQSNYVFFYFFVFITHRKKIVTMEYVTMLHLTREEDL